MGVTTVVPVEPVRTARRSTPFRLGAWTALVAVCLVALLAATVSAFTAARDGTDDVAQRAAVASEASDLYFALADLDSQAARLVLLGNGEPAAAGDPDYESNQLAALIAYNTRTTQATADLRDLAAGAAPSDSSAIDALTSGVTQYHQIADAAIALDQTGSADGGAAASADATQDGGTLGALAGQPVLPALGYYSRATTLLQGILLPEAKNLRDATASDLSSAADSAHFAGLIGAVAAAVLGLLTLVVAVSVNRRMARTFRRRFNPGLVTAGALALVLSVGGAVALYSTARDSEAAANDFAGYLAVAHTRTDSYDADGDVTRFLLMSGIGVTALQADLRRASSDLTALGSPADAATSRWQAVADKDLPAIVNAQNAHDFAGALARDTGIARGQEAFDFYAYDGALITLSNSRLAAFDAGMSAAHGDQSGWSWLPWALIAAGLATLLLGVRARFAEFR